ncbi:hypothetical protein [Polymorphobacter sp.]|uniref:hypothetical protein n=1 Tax=Polymorphobacter sp. TaxID=1909290 RepID=UPI003F71B013
MMRLLSLLALVAAPALAAPLTVDASRFAACSTLAQANPGRAIATAQAWRIEGGGILARHCLALAQFEARDYPAAIASFEGAAKLAEQAPDTKAQALALWIAAANAALLASQPAPVPGFVDAALALAPTPAQAAGLQLLAAEALVDLKRQPAAMAAIDKALALDPAVPDGWLLKATLARRMNNLAAAEAAILEAAKRDTESAEVRYEAGNIAAASGKLDLARAAWTAAISIDPDGVAGQGAKAALAANPARLPK